MAGKGRALLSLTAGVFLCSLEWEEFQFPTLLLGRGQRCSWCCWQVVSVHFSRVLCHLSLGTLHVNLWKHQFVSAGIPIVYLILKEVPGRLIFRKSFPMLEVWAIAQRVVGSPQGALLQPWFPVGVLLRAHGQILQFWGINLQKKK